MITELLSVVALTIVLGLALALASRKLNVKEDPKIEEIYQALPHSNCGACGFPGCMAFARSVAEDNALATRCRVGGDPLVGELAHILGIKLKHEEHVFARVLCKGSKDCTDRFTYHGAQTCRAASLLSSGPKSCSHSCLGFGDCAVACPFSAMSMHDGLPVVDLSKCNGCGLCLKACPKDVLGLTKKSQSTIVRCQSRSPKENAKTCKHGCIACGLCARNCPTKAITVDSLAVVDFDKCNHCGTCERVCPRKTIEIC